MTTRRFDLSRYGTRTVNICDTDFAGGAVPDWNGSTGTDSQPAIQAAIDYCMNTSGQPNATKLICPKGRYKLGDSITWGNQLIVEGEGSPVALFGITGTEFAFSHSKPGCIYLDEGAAQYYEGTYFRDIGFTGVNQAIEQHCIMRVWGAMLSGGGLKDVVFSGFTGCCIYNPVDAGVSAYDQNVTIADVTASGCGAFFGANNTDASFTLGLTDTGLTLSNVRGENGINSAFPQDAFFDYRYARGINQIQTVVEGGDSITSVFRFGGNHANVISGLFLESSFTNMFEFISSPYQWSGGANDYTTKLSEIYGAGANAINFNGCTNMDVLVDNWGIPLTDAIYQETNGASGNTVRTLNTTTL